MANSSEQRFRILHISDLHATEKPTAPFELVLGDAWKANLDQIGTVDFVCFTGDVAMSGAPGDYDRASKFVHALKSALGLPLNRIFIVPGNGWISATDNQAAWTTAM
jgi:3',5'-cyclic AMP phosphodiesterase CpdA